MGVGEQDALGGEPVEAGALYVRVSVGAEVATDIVSVDDHHVGAVLRSHPWLSCHAATQKRFSARSASVRRTGSNLSLGGSNLVGRTSSPPKWSHSCPRALEPASWAVSHQTADRSSRPVWFIVEGNQLVFNTGRDTAKGRALQRDLLVVL